MRNVWFIPSSAALCNWLRRAGFSAVECVNETNTTTAELRRTDWMRFESLAESLQAEDKSRTIEGYPPPRRGSEKPRELADDKVCN